MSVIVPLDEIIDMEFMQPKVSKLDPKIKAQWVAALRSGQYSQCRSSLRTTKQNPDTNEETYSYCCLGVLCDLAKKVGIGNGGYIEGIAIKEPLYLGVPPDLVTEWAYAMPLHEIEGPAWAFIRTGNPPELTMVDEDSEADYLTGIGPFSFLTSINDRGVSFEKIADLIEEYM